jgi:hypothetical protein
MKKIRRRGGYASGQYAYSRLIKFRIMPMTYNELLELQEQKGLSMSHLIRILVNEAMKMDQYSGTEKST